MVCRFLCFPKALMIGSHDIPDFASNQHRFQQAPMIDSRGRHFNRLFFNRFHQVLVIFSYDQHFTLVQDWFQQVPLAMINIFVKFHRFHEVLASSAIIGGISVCVNIEGAC